MKSNQIKKIEILNNKSLAYKYLASRGITNTIGLESLFDAIVHNREIKEPCNALVAEIRNYLTDEVQGQQITFLDKEAKKKRQLKVQKKILGKIADGAITLGDKNSKEIHIAEGLETILSIRESLPNRTEVVFIALGGTKIPSEVFLKDKIVHLWADKDRNQRGQDFAKKFEGKFKYQCKNIFIHYPLGEIPSTQKSLDYNDILLMENGSHIIKMQYLNDIPSRFPQIWSFDSFMTKNFPLNKSIVENFIHSNEIIALVGKAKAGKSLLFMNMLEAFQNSEMFLDSFKVQNNLNALYLNGEIANSCLQERLRNFLPKKELNFNLDICSETFDLANINDAKILGELIDYKKYDLIILDPFYRFFKGDEMSQREMKACFSNLLDELKPRNCACLLICHEGKSNESDTKSTNLGHKIRGSSVFADAVDGIVRLSKKGESEYHLASEFRNRESFTPLILSKQFLSFSLQGKSYSPEKEAQNILVSILNDNPNGLFFKELLRKYQEIMGEDARSKNTISKDLERDSRVEITHSHPKVYKLKSEIPKFQPPIGTGKLENWKMNYTNASKHLE